MKKRDNVVTLVPRPRVATEEDDREKWIAEIAASASKKMLDEVDDLIAQKRKNFQKDLDELGK